MILLAGGLGSRMKASVPKQFLPLGHQRVIDFSIDLFFNEPSIHHIVIVIDSHMQSSLHEKLWTLHSKDSRMIPLNINFALPGKERFFSVSNGVASLPQDCSKIGIHDSARPMLSSRDLRAVFNNYVTEKSILLVKPVTATLKKGDDLLVEKSVSREELYEALTPQVFDAKLLRNSLSLAIAKIEENPEFLKTLTDDEEVVRMISGVHGYMLVAQDPNFKITTPDDLILAESLLLQQSQNRF